MLSQKPIQSRHEFLVGASRSGKTTFLISQILEDLERVERGECSVIVMDIPVHDHSGTLLAYCGRTVKDESPALLFPNGSTPPLPSSTPIGLRKASFIWYETLCTENLNSDVVMVKPAEDRV